MNRTGVRAALHLLVSLLLIAGCGAIPSLDQAKGGVVAVAVALEGGASTLIKGYVGDPAKHPFTLDPGTYYVEVSDAEGMVASLGKVRVVPGAAVALPRSLAEAGGRKDARRSAELRAMVNSLAAAELAKLSALAAASGGYKTRLFDPTFKGSPADLLRLDERCQTLGAARLTFMPAFESFTGRAVAAVPVAVASLGSAPSYGVVDKIKDKLLGFFGYAGDTGKRARERIVKIAESLDGEDRADAFASLRPTFRKDAKDFDSFLELLRSGALDSEAAQMEADLRNAPGFATAAQQAGATVGSIVHREGAELVTRGAELQVEIVKTVLGDVFPDISQGFEYADEVAEWVEYLHEVYKNPVGKLEEAARGKLQEQLEERIKTDLDKWLASLPEEKREELAEKLSEKMVEAIPELAPMLAANATATPTASNGGTGRGSATATATRPTVAATKEPAPPATRTPPKATPLTITIAPPAVPQARSTVVPGGPAPAGTATGGGASGPVSYHVFVLTNVYDGLYLGTEEGLKTRVRCSFEGGGTNCKPTDLVTYRSLLGPFPTKAEAEAALCQNITQTKIFPLGIGLKGRWQGGETWYGLWDGTVTPACLKGK